MVVYVSKVDGCVLSSRVHCKGGRVSPQSSYSFKRWTCESSVVVFVAKVDGWSSVVVFVSKVDRWVLSSCVRFKGGHVSPQSSCSFQRWTGGSSVVVFVSKLVGCFIRSGVYTTECIYVDLKLKFVLINSLTQCILPTNTIGQRSSIRLIRCIDLHSSFQ